MIPPREIDQTIALTIKEQWGRLLAILAQSFGDIELAEDVLQDAVVKALVKWKQFGIPESPTAWLLKTAKHKAIDRYRKDQRFACLKDEIQHLQALEEQSSIVELESSIPDKRLELIYACCHPTLADKSQIVLTLHTLGGLTVPEIANAFLSKPDAIAQRLVRAKRKLKSNGIGFELPQDEHIQARTNSVLSTVYFIFNESYKASAGEQLTRQDLSEEAIRLAKILITLLPENCEAYGLLALMLLHNSRFAARQSDNGELISLENQNRQLWNQNKIADGIALLEQCLVKKQFGSYQLQAAISAVHAQASDWESTDWPQIVALYNLLYQIQPTAVVRMNQAVAISYAGSIHNALEIFNELSGDDTLSDYQPYFAAKADLLLRAGELTLALQAFDTAIALSKNDAERNFLLLRKLQILPQSAGAEFL